MSEELTMTIYLKDNGDGTFVPVLTAEEADKTLVLPLAIPVP